jgi:galactokinase
LSQLPALAAAMAPVTGGYGGRGSGGGGGNTYIIVNANGNITESNQKLGEIVSKALLDKMNHQGKLG